MSDAAVAEARRRLAAMRGSLEGLRQHQAQERRARDEGRHRLRLRAGPCGSVRVGAAGGGLSAGAGEHLRAGRRSAWAPWTCQLLEDTEAKLKTQLEELLIEAEKARGCRCAAGAAEGFRVSETVVVCHGHCGFKGSCPIRTAKVKPRREDIESLFYSDQGLF